METLRHQRKSIEAATACKIIKIIKDVLQYFGDFKTTVHF